MVSFCKIYIFFNLPAEICYVVYITIYFFTIWMCFYAFSSRLCDLLACRCGSASFFHAVSIFFTCFVVSQSFDHYMSSTEWCALPSYSSALKWSRVTCWPALLRWAVVGSVHCMSLTPAFLLLLLLFCLITHNVILIKTAVSKGSARLRSEPRLQHCWSSSLAWEEMHPDSDGTPAPARAR